MQRVLISSTSRICESCHVVFSSKHALTALRPNSSSAHPTHLILPPLVPTHRLELALLCRLCSSRHLQMTQQLTHLLHKHTHTHTLIHTHALQPPPAVPREAYAGLKPCALIQPVLIPGASSTHSEPPQRLPRSSPLPGCVCPPICLSSDHSFPLPPPSIFTLSSLRNVFLFF